jgi:acetyl esterase/lipase
MLLRALSPAASLIVILGLASVVTADGPQDNQPDTVRRIPKLGIEVPRETREELEKGLADLRRAIEKVTSQPDDRGVAEKGRAAARAARQARDSRIARFLPDVLVYEKAVRDALVYQEFFAPQELAKAKDLLKEGLDRANHLEDEQPPWTTQTGLVVRGYISKIDGSVQPYGLVIPESYTTRGPGRFRLDVWFHGRGETLSELNFVDQQRRQPGQFTPVDTIVLHPYGRYSNAFKFAGEVDVLEAIEAVQRHYRIDDDRIAVRGFSMGGAGCWQFAVHYSDRWFAANPGAGFAETPRFLAVFQKETLQPSSYEQRLWHLYDCTDVAANLLQCPTVAYSGEIDTQKQAADVMAEALKAEGIELLHVIGPATKHAYHPDSKREVERRLDSLAVRGRRRYPASIHFTTYTLKYNRMSWVTIDALGEHWTRARVRAESRSGGPVVTTANVAALTLAYPAGESPYPANAPVQVTIDGTRLTVPGSLTDRSWACSLRRDGDRWEVGAIPGDRTIKRHDIQGPIDDAFMDSFVFVRPTGTSPNPRFAGWVAKEMPRAVEHWRRHFRGEARVKDDTAIGDQDIASSNLVLWGDPDSNAILRRIAGRLPIAWDRARIKVGADGYASDQHALILIAPNPLNPARYVVLNSGFTFREYDYLNNARQVPKLPDWAVVDLTTPPGSRYPGKVVAADFFGEDWKVK